MGIFTYKKLFLLLLLFANLLLFIKLDFFITELSGNVTFLDFDNYYRLVNDLKKGINPYSVSYMQTLGPPPVFFYFLPFSYLDLNTARSLATSISLSSGFLTAFFLGRYFSGKEPFKWFLIFTFILFSSFPARFTIGMGQPNLLLTLFVTTILLNQRKSLISVLTALAITIKTYLVFIPFAFLNNNKNIFNTACILVFILVLIFFPLIPPESYNFYIENKFFNIVQNAGVSTGLNYYNQSYVSTQTRFGTGYSITQEYLMLIPLAIFTVYKLKSVELAVILGLLLSFVTWQHYFVMLFPIFVLAFKRSGKIGLRTILLIFYLFFWWTEFPWLHNADINFFTRVLASHYFLSALGLGIYMFFLIRYEELKA